MDAGFFLENRKSFCKLNFQLYTDLALKLDKGRILGGGKHPPPPWTYFTNFSNHEDEIQS